MATLTAKPEKIPPEQEQSVIVGIGASAGGLEALRELLPNLPIDKHGAGATFSFTLPTEETN